jgi:hypothetical protein
MWASRDGMIYVLGGQSLASPASKFDQEYDPATDRWRENPRDRRGLNQVTVGERRYSFRE